MDNEEMKDQTAEEMVSESADETENSEVTEEAVEEAVKETEKAEEAVMERLLRLQADFENYKKRTQKEKADTFKFAVEGLMIKLLPVLDNLERAEAAASDDTGAYREGVEMVFKQLISVLGDEGLKAIETEGVTFDPNFHHGVAVGEDADKKDQEIMEVFQKGYVFKEKVIRPAMVKVCQK